jgi:hypothetical protein
MRELFAERNEFAVEDAVYVVACWVRGSGVVSCSTAAAA